MIKIFKLIKKENILWFLLALFFSAIECTITSFQPFLLAKITTNFQLVFNNNNDQAVIAIATQDSINLIVIILVAVTIGLISRILSRAILIRIAIGMMQKLRNELFTKIQWIKENEFNHLSISSLVTRATNDAYQYQEAVLSFFLFFFESVILIIGSLIFCIIISPILSSVFLLIIPLILFTNFWSNKKAKKYYTQNLNELDSVNRVMRENIIGIKMVHSFLLSNIQAVRFDNHNKNWYKTIYKGEFLIYAGNIFWFFIINAAVIIVLLISGIYNKINIGTGYEIEVASVVAFANYLIYIVFCIYGISNSIVSINRTKPCILRIEEILKKDCETKNRDESFKEIDFVEFKDVCFSYNKNNEDKPLINKINFKVKRGEVLGIIGATGSGKSTIVDLAANILTPDSGQIIYGSQQETNANAIRKQISVAFQEKYIFSGTIKSNIIMGNLNSEENEINNAIQLACAFEFINNRADKLDSVVTINGNNLSGGQKQRIAIARAFLKEAQLYILDDSLSALDNLTRNQILKNIQTHFKDKFVILVSQQIKTIKNADNILVIEKGEIKAKGNHNELLKKCSLYKKIYDSQKTIGQ
ncbi:MAG: ABC transporter ATP-binding protein [Malacoplasma sp.]|nr:ABC transporter ATP-binding protein [Malacoplasma sp.]